jgi:small-conductance mechanosensitive channel
MKEDINIFISDLFIGITELLPRLIMVVAILLAGYLIGRLVQKLVKRLILYLNQGLNQRLQNNLLNVDLKNSATFISRTLFWMIIIFTILICIEVLNLDFVSKWIDLLIIYLPNVLAAIIIVFVGIVSGRLLGDLIKSAASRAGIFNGKYLGRSVRYLIIFISIVIAADQLGVDIAFLSNLFMVLLAAALFGASLAFGLGAKTSVSNILGSYYAKKSYQLGMKIKLGDIEGTIVRISDCAISLETQIGIVMIPAKDFNESKVIVLKDTSK